MLWSWSGRLGWATRWTSRVGVLFAVLLAALGLARAGAASGVKALLVALTLFAAMLATAGVVAMVVERRLATLLPVAWRSLRCTTTRSAGSWPSSACAGAMRSGVSSSAPST
jgi:hypothetical protein